MIETTIRALIVDDEPPARAIIRRMLKDDPDIEVVGECSNGSEAIEALRDLSPDLLFLDIRMPETDGFAVLESLGEDRVPVTIFVTAYDRYALRAFDYYALDYLLKPFDHERFEKALLRAKANLKGKSADDRSRQMLALLKQINARSEYLDRFVIKSNGRVLFVNTDEVDWIETSGNYLTLHAGKTSHLIRETLHNVEQQLDPRKFLRIHRSTMVNINSVKEMRVHVNDDRMVILKDGSELTLSRRYREKVSRVLGTTI